MLIAEEFLLLCLNDETGRKSISGEKIDPALGGAILVELALMERIGITPDDLGWIKRRRITITSTKPTDDAVLDDALAYLQMKEGKKIQDVITPMAWKPMTKDMRVRLLERLAGDGVLSEQHSTSMRIFTITSWPTVDPTVETEIRARLRSALVDGLTPTERTVALIGLLHATGHIHQALPDEDKKLVTRRAKELAEGDWAAAAVMAVIASIHSTAVAAASGGS